MAKISSPNKSYNGKVANVTFVKGQAETNDQWLINWFENKGYKVDRTDDLEKERIAKEQAEKEQLEKEELERKQKEEDEKKEEKKKPKGEGK